MLRPWPSLLAIARRKQRPWKTCRWTGWRWKDTTVGTVTAIDAEAGTITVDHEPVAELGWPQMVMAFDASEEVRGDISVGDAIKFTVEATDEGNTITAITKQ